MFDFWAWLRNFLRLLQHSLAPIFTYRRVFVTTYISWRKKLGLLGMGVGDGGSVWGGRGKREGESLCLRHVSRISETLSVTSPPPPSGPPRPSPDCNAATLRCLACPCLFASDKSGACDEAASAAVSLLLFCAKMFPNFDKHAEFQNREVTCIVTETWIFAWTIVFVLWW